MSDEEPERVLKTKGDPIVSYCSVCGVEFDAKVPNKQMVSDVIRM